jgi:predicted CXXCH cytochrome family protein
MKLCSALPSVLVAGAGLFALVLASCSTVPRSVIAPPQIEGATFVGNKTCVECHAEFTRAFPASPHARLRLEGAPHGESAGCESCHGPASLHVKAGGGRRHIVNPGRDPQACFTCHLDVHAQFKLPQHHPVIEGRMNCVQCHDPHGADILKPSHRTALGVRPATGMARLNESCAECHREQARPMIHEHEALREGCTICHQPHGSIADKMLVQRDNNLCLKCHAQVPTAGGQIYIGTSAHTEYLRRGGGCWVARCHTAVHGSNIDRRLLY